LQQEKRSKKDEVAVSRREWVSQFSVDGRERRPNENKEGRPHLKKSRMEEVV